MYVLTYKAQEAHLYPKIKKADRFVMSLSHNNHTQGLGEALNASAALMFYVTPEEHTFDCARKIL